MSPFNKPYYCLSNVYGKKLFLSRIMKLEKAIDPRERWLFGFLGNMDDLRYGGGIQCIHHGLFGGEPDPLVDNFSIFYNH